METSLPRKDRVDMPNQVDNQHFGDVLRGHRLRKGRTQKHVADFSTISIRAIRDLEQGKARRPRRSTVELLADALCLDDWERDELVAAADRSSCMARARVEEAEFLSPPAPRRPLLGREQEAESLVRSLTAPGRRVLSVTGAPGVGKSRLALETADRIHRMTQSPVLWADESLQADIKPDYHRLGGLDSTVRAASRELFGQEVAEQEPSSGIETLVRMLGDRTALLVLEAPRGGTADTAVFEHLLAACPELRILATGRQPLGLPDERVALLQPLDVQHASELLAAHMSREELGHELADLDESAVAQMCRLLDGLPGALIAAASWCAVYDHDVLLPYLAEDPRYFLAPLPGATAGGTGCSLSEALEDCSESERGLLSLLRATPDGESPADLGRMAGLSPGESGWVLNGLALRGLVRSDKDSGTLRFRALNLVRALHPVDGARQDRASACETVIPV